MQLLGKRSKAEVTDKRVLRLQQPQHVQERKATLCLSAGVDFGLALGERRSTLATVIKDYQAYLPLAAKGSRSVMVSLRHFASIMTSP